MKKQKTQKEQETALEGALMLALKLACVVLKGARGGCVPDVRRLKRLGGRGLLKVRIIA
jgi:hypothetical protein